MASNIYSDPLVEPFTMTKKICIIIPTYNRWNYLKELLASIYHQSIADAIALIPIVVIDGSTDGTMDQMKQEFPQVPVILGTGNWWWSRSVNEGGKYAISKYHPDYILLLNDDSIIQPNYIQTLLDAYNTLKGPAVIGSISVSDTQPHLVSFAGIKKVDWWKLKTHHYYKAFTPLNEMPTDGLKPTYALNGRGIFASAAIFSSLGFLNAKDFPQYGSDDDFAQRAWKKNIPVYISFSCRVYDRTLETSKGTAFRQDSLKVFLSSFITWNSVNYIPKQLKYFWAHGYKLLIPFYFFKFLLGTSNAYFFKYKKK